MMVVTSETQEMAGAKRPYSSMEDIPTEAADNQSACSGENENSVVIQTTKSKGIVNVQLFIRKAFAMINECDPNIAAWIPEGDKFIVKNKELFATKIIPQYYDHNNYSSFTRQLNFYGFSREQSMCIKITDEEAGNAGQETFYHPYFQRGRPDLLKNLQRKPRENDKRKRKKSKVDDVDMLQEKVSSLEQENADMEMTIRRLEESSSLSKMAIQKLEYQQSAKDMTLDSMKNHIDRLEAKLNALVNHQQQFQNNRNHWQEQQQQEHHHQRQQHHRNSSLSSNPAPVATAPTLQRGPAPAALGPAPSLAQGPTLAPHPNKKKFDDSSNHTNDLGTTSSSSSNNINDNNKDNSSSNNNNGFGQFREASLDLLLSRDTSVLSRENSMMNWLSRLTSR